MTTPQTDPVRRNEAEQAPPNQSIDESMAEADRANGEGDPVDASQVARNDEHYGEEDKPKAIRRAD